MRYIVLLSGLLLAHGQALFAANAPGVACPPMIETIESVKSVPAHWQAFDSAVTHTWQTVTFYDGHPKEMASLVPDNANKRQATWTFSSQRERDIYISCGYARSGVELIQALPKNMTHCDVHYDVNAQGEFGSVPTKIRCG